MEGNLEAGGTTGVETEAEGSRDVTGGGAAVFQWVLARLELDYPGLDFKAGRKFAFRAPKTVRIPQELWAVGKAEALLSSKIPQMSREQRLCIGKKALDKDFGAEHGQKLMLEQENEPAVNQKKEDVACEEALRLLHEVGHAILQHKSFRTDVERLKMERAAWEQARELCARYNIYYDEDLVEGALDSYRDWLHQKSACPECGLTRYQSRDGKYHCPSCGT